MTPLPFGAALAGLIETGLGLGDWLQDIAARPGSEELLYLLERSFAPEEVRAVVASWAIYGENMPPGAGGEMPDALRLGRVLLDLARNDDLAPLLDALDRLSDAQVRSVALAWLFGGRPLMRSGGPGLDDLAADDHDGLDDLLAGGEWR